MRKRIVAGNWKMNTTLQEGKMLLSRLLDASLPNDVNRKIIIIPPFTHLSEFGNLLKDSPILLGAQNISYEVSGAFTGEVSASMVKACGSDYVIIGHSERRQYFNENNDLLALKIDLALDHELTPIYCCGEREEDRDKGTYFSIIGQQIKEGLFHLDNKHITKLMIAYEPVWAIGTGKNATPSQAQEVQAFIRKMLSEKYGTNISSEITILYGGSIKGTNACELFTQPDIDGGLVGGASLNIPEFLQIIEAL